MATRPDTPTAPTLRRDAQRNLERLEAAAIEVFYERGLGSPLEEIANRAGVSIGTLYNRFGSREQVIDAVVPTVVAAKLDAVATDALAGGTPWERFARYLDGLFALQASDPILSDVLERAHELNVERLIQLCAATLTTAGQLIQAAQADGTLRPDFTVEDLAAELIANAGVIKSQATSEEAWRRHLALLLAGLRTSAPR